MSGPHWAVPRAYKTTWSHRFGAISVRGAVRIRRCCALLTEFKGRKCWGCGGEGHAEEVYGLRRLGAGLPDFLMRTGGPAGVAQDLAYEHLDLIGFGS